MAKKQISVSLRKPPPPADLERLVVEAVEGASEARRPEGSATRGSGAHSPATPKPPTSDVSDLGTPPPPANTVTSVEDFVAKAKPGFCTITIDLPEKVADQLAAFCAESGRDVHEVVAEILAKHFAEKLKTVVEPAPSQPTETTMDAIVAWLRDRIRLASAMRARMMRLGQMVWASL